MGAAALDEEEARRRSWSLQRRRERGRRRGKGEGKELSLFPSAQLPYLKRKEGDRGIERVHYLRNLRVWRSNSRTIWLTDDHDLVTVAVNVAVTKR